MASDELLKQVEREAAEIAAAPVVHVGAAVTRCHWCGQLASSGSVVEVVHEQERFKGVCCGG